MRLHLTQRAAVFIVRTSPQALLGETLRNGVKAHAQQNAQKCTGAERSDDSDGCPAAGAPEDHSRLFWLYRSYAPPSVAVCGNASGCWWRFV